MDSPVIIAILNNVLVLQAAQTSAVFGVKLFELGDILVMEEYEHKVKLKYLMKPGRRYYIRTYRTVVDDSEVDSVLRHYESDSYLKINMPCDAGLLDKERDRVVSLLHREGYYRVLKNFVSFEVDTLRGPDDIALTMFVEGKTVAADTTGIYTRYSIRNVVVDVNLEQEAQQHCDTVSYRGMELRYHGSRQLRPNVIYSQMKLLPGDRYNEDNVRSSYRNFSNLQALRYAIIRMEQADSGRLDCHVTLQTNKVNSISAELEGTNTSGDLGVASSVSFTNRNLFRGSEVWTTKVRGLTACLNSRCNLIRRTAPNSTAACSQVPGATAGITITTAYSRKWTPSV